MLSRQRGDTLLEVTAALGVLTLAALGSLALQGWVAQSEDSARRLDLAVGAAASAAEAAQAGLGSALHAMFAQDLAQALPDGHIVTEPADQGLVRLDIEWSEPPRWGMPTPAGVGTCAGQSVSRAGWQPRCLSIWVAP
jgi:type II secretory pathway pseudopilin PulG